MRDILFKAKGQTSEKWYEGLLTRLDKDVCHIKGKHYEEWICDPSTICQYTGLHDGTKWEELSEKEQRQFLSEWNYEKGRKNQKEDWKGKKIWENDVVRVRHEKYPETINTEFDLLPVAKVYTRNYAVEFINTGSSYGYRCRNRSIHFLITKNVIYNHDVEVCGNIFDNPELLKDGD